MNPDPQENESNESNESNETNETNETNQETPVNEIQQPLSNNKTNTYQPMSFPRNNTTNRRQSKSMSRSKTRSKTPSKQSRPSNTTRKNVKGNSAALQKKAFYIFQDAIAKTDKMNAKSASAFITSYFLIKKYGKTPLGDQLRSFVNSGKLNQTKFITPGHHKGAIANAVKATKRLS